MPVGSASVGLGQAGLVRHGKADRCAGCVVVASDAAEIHILCQVYQSVIAPRQPSHAPAPNQLWSGDITYIQTDEGWLYLAAVIDLFNFDWKAIAQVHPADLCQCSHVDHSLIPSCSKNKQETL
ncbi:MAG: hypothetical protein WDA10_14075, partial [Porticoccaceae bacterium]